MHVPILSGPARDLWIEIGLRAFPLSSNASGPARDLWIEIQSASGSSGGGLVGSRKGPVD